MLRRSRVCAGQEQAISWSLGSVQTGRRSPAGSGHGSLVIGWDPWTRQLLLPDPNGEVDLVQSATGAPAGWRRARAEPSDWSC